MSYEGNYRPGAWAGVTTPNAWLLADLPVTDDRIAQAWSALREGLGADQALDALLGQGMAGLPGFALAVAHDDTLRVIVRRDAAVLIRLGTEERSVEGSSGTWQDIELPLPVDHLQLRHLTAGGSDSDTGVPVGLGIVQASRIDLFAVATTATPAAPEPAVEPVPDPVLPSEPVVPESVAPDYSDLFAGTQDRDAFIARLAQDDAAASEAAELYEEPTPMTPPPTPADATAIWNVDPDVQPAAPAVARTAADVPPPAPASSPSGLIDGLPWLSASPAAPTSNAPPPPPRARVVPVVPVTPHPASPPPPPPVRPSALTMPGLPDLPAPAPAFPPPPAPEPPGEESAALTVSRAELLAAMGSHGIVGPSVLAVRCAAGHLTPPEQDRCRVCGVHVDAAQPGEVPRPTLGVFRSSAGEAVILDRDVVFGRAPQASASRAASQPHLVKVVDPGISRSHLHVALDGWQVMVRDLGSSNGTEIQLPGGEPEKLRAQEDYLIEPGTVVTLAGDVHYTFEVTA